MAKLILTAVLILAACVACSETGPLDPSGGQPGPEKIVITTLTNISTGKNNPVTLSATAYYTNEDLGTSTAVPLSNFSWSTASDMVFTSATNKDSVTLTSSGAAGVFSRTVTVAAWHNGVRTEKTVTINHTVDWALMPQQPGMNAETLRIAPNGDIYIVSDYNTSGEIEVKKFNGNNWETLPVLSGSFYLPHYMDLDQNGVPYVLSGNSVYRFANGAWVQLGNQPFHSTGARHPAICLGANGSVYVSFADTTNSYKAKVMQYDGYTWSAVGTSGISIGEVFYTHMKIYNNTLYLTYNDTLADGIYVGVKALISGTWQAIGSQKVSANGGQWNQLHVSPDNKLYIQFAETSKSYNNQTP